MLTEKEKTDAYVDSCLAMFEKYQNRMLDLVGVVDRLPSKPWEMERLTRLPDGLSLREVAAAVGQFLIKREMFGIDDRLETQLAETGGKQWGWEIPRAGQHGNFEHEESVGLSLVGGMVGGKKYKVELECGDNVGEVLRVTEWGNQSNRWRLQVYRGWNVDLSHEWKEETEIEGGAKRTVEVNEYWGTPYEDRVPVELPVEYDSFLEIVRRFSK